MGFLQIGQTKPYQDSDKINFKTPRGLRKTMGRFFVAEVVLINPVPLPFCPHGLALGRFPKDRGYRHP